ncbi:MAG: hypothetical protein QW666_03785, partial [Candidatus Woesearchaeota archaeon]
WLSRPLLYCMASIVIALASNISSIHTAITNYELKREVAAIKSAYTAKEKEFADFKKKLDSALKGIDIIKQNCFEISLCGHYCRIKAKNREFKSSNNAGINIAEVLKLSSQSYQQGPEDISNILCNIDSDGNGCISDVEAGLAREKTEVHYRNLEVKACQILSELDKY